MEGEELRSKSTVCKHHAQYLGVRDKIAALVPDLDKSSNKVSSSADIGVVAVVVSGLALVLLRFFINTITCRQEINISDWSVFNALESRWKPIAWQEGA